MQIVIPMSGFGERFRRAGYTVPKPLVEIDGKPIIAHVIDMFPGETDFIFICNREHLANEKFQMEDILKLYCPTGKIVAIDAHKLGPIHAVTMASEYFDLNKPTIVSYCDFTCYWDWGNFCKFVEQSKCDGAIPAYKGFHPHSLGTTNYAYIRESGGWVEDIQEKQPYTDNRMQEFASSGSYYFSSARLMLDAFQKTKTQNLNVEGEYYVSLAYKPLLACGRKVAVYPVQHFMQWGTPEDVAEYCEWSKIFRGYLAPSTQTEIIGTIIIPMAGLGKRFAREGYIITKPLIPVSGRPMVFQAINDLPVANNYVFVLRADMNGVIEISDNLLKFIPQASVATVPAVTDGQACTALIGLDYAEKYITKVLEPITFGACDNGSLYDQAKLKLLLDNPDIDVVVWAVRGHVNAIRHPEMFGWIDEKNGDIQSVSVKKPLASPQTDPIIIGTFTFRSAEVFRQCFNRMVSRGGRVNGEFYLDSCINDALEIGLNCKIFEVENFISWGTPNDLKTFEYWQSCFHKWSGHAYRINEDSRIPLEEVESLELMYEKLVPATPIDCQ